MNQQDALIYIFINSTIFMSTLHVLNDQVFHHQQFIVVYSITQLYTIVRMFPAALVLLLVAKQMDTFARLYTAV
jgi:hypothetical protein